MEKRRLEPTTLDEQPINEPPSDDEALKLVMRFYCILEPDRQRELLALAQRYASAAQEVDGPGLTPQSLAH